jgi:hypothetical protein
VRWDDLEERPQELLLEADAWFQRTLEANSAQPYDHAAYERYLGLARATLVLAFDGDVNTAFALEQCFHDSNESMEYYLTRWDADELRADYGSGYGITLRVKFEVT